MRSDKAHVDNHVGNRVQFEISVTAETILYMLDFQSTCMVRGSFLFLHSVQSAKRHLT